MFRVQEADEDRETALYAASTTPAGGWSSQYGTAIHEAVEQLRDNGRGALMIGEAWLLAPDPRKPRLLGRRDVTVPAPAVPLRSCFDQLWDQ